MANLKEIRVRITSVTTTRQITSAMKMVSAAKLKKAQDAILQMRPYAQKMKEVLLHVSSESEEGGDNIYTKERHINKVAIVLITSNRGLCGAFNANAIKLALNIATNKYSRQMQAGNVKFITIGKKGNDSLRNRKIAVENSFNDVLDKPSFDKVVGVAQYLTDLYVTAKVDKIILVYNKFKNAGVQILTEEQFLPLKKEHAEKEVMGIRPNFEFEPNQDYILKELIPKTLKIELFKAVLDSNASEHGARMTAMHKATDNATDLIKQLTLTYNKARQATITGEILEIVGGAEALKG